MSDKRESDYRMNNIAKIAELFPHVITETTDENGMLKRAIDFELLKQSLSDDIAEGKESYTFTWVGKKAAIAQANAPTHTSLHPCKEESKNWDQTKNVYIEGDNLDALKHLQKNYSDKIKIIYIDPPYNTGKDFIFKDNFTISKKEYKFSGDPNEAHGRLHSQWCSMIYPRLALARNLLTEDGVIFISIDDNEADNLKKICDQIFGEENFTARFLWTKTATPPSLSNKCRKTVEYVLCYEKKKNNKKYFGETIDNGDAPLLNTSNPIKTILFPEHSIQFHFIKDGILKAGNYEKVELIHDATIRNGKNETPVLMKGRFKWEQSTLYQELKKGTYFLAKTKKLSIRFQRKNSGRYKAPNNFLDVKLDKELGVGTNEAAVKELACLGLDGLFDFPKPISLVKQLIKMCSHEDKNAIILDFFSGSGTTAQAVMELNAEDGGNRRFIMVQLPEPCAPGSIAYQSGFSNICEIGRERIRRAGERIKEMNPNTKTLDVGFRAYKVKED